MFRPGLPTVAARFSPVIGLPPSNRVLICSAAGSRCLLAYRTYTVVITKVADELQHPDEQTDVSGCPGA